MMRPFCPGSSQAQQSLLSLMVDCEKSGDMLPSPGFSQRPMYALQWPDVARAFGFCLPSLQESASTWLFAD